MIADFNKVFRKNSKGELITAPSVEFTASCNWNSELLEMLTGNSNPPTFDLHIIAEEFYIIPRRKHRKKRIQKKWIKRYGYQKKSIPVQREIKNAKLEELSKDNDIYEANFVIE